MFEKSFFSSDALLKNICVSCSLAQWLNYTFFLGWLKDNSTNLLRKEQILYDEGFMRLIAIVYKEIFSLDPLSIFMKGLIGQIEFFGQAVKGLYPPIILLSVIYFFYYKKNNYRS